MMYTTKLETITPEIAEKYLLTMGLNRSLRPGAVQAFAQQIRSGSFALIPEGIAFDMQGKLRDGQHRLAAIALVGKAVPMHVHRNMTEDQIAALDQGTVRNAADVEVMAGDTRGRLHVSMVRHALELAGAPKVKMMTSAYRAGMKQIGEPHVREIATLMPGPACVTVIKTVLALARPLDPAAIDLLAVCAYAGKSVVAAETYAGIFGPPDAKDKKQEGRNQTLSSLLEHRRGIRGSADVIDCGRRWARGVKAWLDGEGLTVLKAQPVSFEWLMAQRKAAGLCDAITCTEAAE